MTNPKKLIITNHQSPGDIIVLTSAIRDLHKAHPNKYITDIRTSASQIWENNPYITKLSDNDPDVQIIKAEYPLIHQSNTLPYHFIHGFRMDLEQKLGISIPAGKFCGDIHISNLEKSWMSQLEEMGIAHDNPIWLVSSGGKNDFTAKWPDPHKIQEVIDYFWGKIIFCQIGAKEHYHPPLKNVIDLRGKTDHRQLIRLVYHCDGCITPNSYLMHLAAAVPTKPSKSYLRACIVIAGGRENTNWFAYPSHTVLHTIGALPCCSSGGCWISRTVALPDNDEKNNSLCKMPVVTPQNLTIPKCLDMVKSYDIIRAVEKYMEYYKLNG